MRKMAFAGIWRAGTDRAVLPRTRTFGSARETFNQRLVDVLTPESLFRLILAFVLATALWLYVTSRNAPEAAFPYANPIAISPENIGTNLTVTTLLPPVHVDIRPSVNGFTPPLSSFIASVNLSGLRPGRYNHIPVSFQPNSSQVSVVSWGPRSVSLTLERVVTRVIPVRIEQLSAPPYGYSVAGLSSSPSTVSVTGAESFVKEVSQAVIPVSLASTRSSLNAEYTPTLRNGQGASVPSRVTVAPPSVRVHATIEQLASFKTLPILASIQGEPAAGFGVTSIQVSPPGLTAYGAPKVLSSLQNIRTSMVNLHRLRAGRKTFKARLIHPPGVYFGARRVEVAVTVGPVSGDAVTRVAVRPEGVKSGDVAVSRPSAVLVTITGPAPQLSSAGSRIKAVANVSGFGVGTFTVTPVIHGPKGVHVDVVQPTRVTVTIRQG